MSRDLGAGPLADVRVIDLADEQGAYCTKLLADLGADVIKLEPPGGDPTRWYQPFYQDRPDPNGSLFFWYHNLNKRSVRINLGDPAGQAAFRELAATADILVESRPTGPVDGWRPDWAAVQARNPRLIRTTLTPFGETGPHAGWTGNDLTTWAMSGAMLACGDADRPPLRAAGGQSNILASLYAAVATLAALDHQRRTGQGQAIEVSLQESSILQSEGVHYFYQYARTFVRRVKQGQHPLAVPILAARTRDGFCEIITYSRAQWDALVAWLAEAGRAGDLTEKRWVDPAERWRNRDHVHDQIEAFTREYGKQELFAEARRRDLAFGPVLTPAEVAADPGLAARGFFVPVPRPGSDDGPRILYPGAPYRLETTPWAIRSPAPELPTETAIAWRPRPTPPAVPVPGERTAPGDGPLAGLRILDFSWVLAGPFATMLLADLGADVIKVEAPGVGDPVRGQAPLDPRGTPPNNSGFFNAANRGKRSIALNLRHPRGRAIAQQLARSADIVIENFSPGTFERLIGDPAEWRRERPELIVVRLSGFGQTGPRRDYMGYAPTLHALSGLAYLTADDSTSPTGFGISLSDYLGGFHGAVALLAALHHRRRTGLGQTIDVGQFESMVATLGPAILEATANGRDPEPAGNRLTERPDAPQGVYPGRVPPAPADGPAETEAWIAIAVTSDAHWAGLRAALGDPKWMADPALADAPGRCAAADRIDAAVSAWTSRHLPWDAVRQLQAHGVPAGVAANGRDLFERDPHLAERGFFVTVEPPELGPIRIPGPVFRLERTPARIWRPAPLIGQQTEAILRDDLGLSDAEITDLILNEVV